MKPGKNELPRHVWRAKSYAKINLGLHVLERLENGYHNIETGFCFINWFDYVQLRPSLHRKLSMGESNIPADHTNLIWKALDVFKKEHPLAFEFEVKVQKHIPAGAGLGGGSSNAATVLRMLNKIAKNPFTDEELATLGAALGADVPIFIKGLPAIGTGTGTNITPADIQPSAWIVTAFPDINSSTAEAYAYCVPEIPEFSVEHILTEEPLDQWEILLQNTLETAVFPRFELIGNLKDQLYDFGAVYASMSGSGSSVFGIFEQEFVAIEAHESLTMLGYTSKITEPNFIPDMQIISA